MRLLLLLFLLIVPTPGFSTTEPTICHNELAAWMSSKKPLKIVDIQVADEFTEHHYDGSLPCGGNLRRLRKVSLRLRAGKEKIILVSTNGGADARQALETMVAAGVDRGRILILEGGMEAAARNAACDCCTPASRTAGSH
jgi:rhodanese-related sulfurtransferase